MARAIAGATISFGLVSIPVKLYAATQASAGVSFNLLHSKCGTRLKQQYICPRDNEIVGRDDMVKGYEFAKDQYVTFTPEELKSLEEKATQSIDIAEFVPLSAIDPVYFDRPYYLGPEKGGDKAYRLLAEAMRESGRAALARYAARGKQYLVMLRPSADGRGARPAAAALRGRGAPDVRGAAARRRGARAGAQARQAAHRPDRVRDVRSDAVPRRRPGADPGRHRAQGAGAGHHRGRRAARRARAHHRPHGGAEGQPRQGRRRQGRRAARAEQRRGGRGRRARSHAPSRGSAVEPGAAEAKRARKNASQARDERKRRRPSRESFPARTPGVYSRAA